ncbi:MAG: MBL fold metallo-hydrolase RNA specificity domain-containing protein [bacterium]
MVTLTFYDGADCVGGNKFLLEAAGTALFLDFGKNFSREAFFFDDFMPPRATAGLCDYLELDLLPPLEGIYRPEYEMSGRAWEHCQGHPAQRRLHLDGILLTHAHLDHSGYLSFLDVSTPIYSGLATALIVKAMQDTGRSGMSGEIAYAMPRIEANGVLGTQRGSKDNPCPALLRPLVLLEPEQPRASEFLRAPSSARSISGNPALYLPNGEAQAGNLRIRRYPVDHSIPGAGAFAIDTPSGWVVYTGDLRLHGSQSAATRAFFRLAAALHPRALICEATRIIGEKGEEIVATTEEDVLDQACQLVRQEKGLVIADFGPRNVVRLLSFLQAAAEAGRQLVITDKDAYLLKALRLGDPSVPDPLTDSRIAVYREVRGSYAQWQTALLESFQASCPERLVTSADLRKSPGNYVVCFSYWDLQELVDILPKGGLYIYSSCEAFNEEMAIDQERLLRWIDHFGLRPVGSLKAGEESRYAGPALHASGHIDTAGVIEMVETIRPRTLLPVHGERREYYRQRFGKLCQVILPNRGEQIILD